MANISQDLTQVNQEAVETALEFAQLSIESAERVVRMQLEAAKQFVAQQSKTATVLAGVKDEQELAVARTRLAEQAVESLLGYSRNVSEMAAQAQRELAKMVEKRFGAYQRNMTAAMQNLAQSGPAGSHPAVGALNSTMMAAANAVENMTKAAKQAAELAEANVKAMTEAAANALKSGSKKKG